MSGSHERVRRQAPCEPPAVGWVRAVAGLKGEHAMMSVDRNEDEA